MIRYTLLFVVGVVLFQYQPRLPHAALFVAYLALVVCAVPLRWCRWPAWLVMGFAWAHGHAWLTQPEPWPAISATEFVWATGRVVSLVDERHARRRFVFEVSRVESGDRPVHGRWLVQVTWYKDAPPMAPDESWRLRLRVRPVGGYANPGGFDYAHWLYQQGIVYLASVDHRAENRRQSVPDGMGFTALRQLIIRGIDDAFVGQAEAGGALLRALVVGDRSGFSQHDWQHFRATGTNHLVAISGLHVGLVAALAMGLVSSLWRRIAWLCERWPARQAGAVAGWCAAWGYAGMAGFAIPTQRALLMLTAALLMVLLARRSRALDLLCVALLAVVGWSPPAVMSPGLWLSFAAVAAILWALVGGAHGGWSLLWRWLRVQLVISLCLLPMLLGWFQQASLLGTAVNLVAIPVFSLLLVPLGLLSTLVWLLWPLGGAWLWQMWAEIAEQAMRGIAWAGSVSWAVWTTPSTVMAATVALLGFALMFLPRAVPGRVIAPLLILPLFINRPAAPDDGGFQFELLDVGQGLAVLVRTSRHNLLYDAGPAYRSGFDAGTAVVLPRLRGLGVAALDRLVVSHSDTDHAGGVAAVVAALEVGDILAGEPSAHPLARSCLAGQRWHWDGVDFEILYPFEPGHAGNNASCVMRVSNAAGSLLVTGDIEAAAEQKLISAGGLGSADVVVAPHHGSRTSSTPALVSALAPAHVLYATGRHNRWGFPKADVVARWRSVGATSWDTARDGAVSGIFPSDGTPVELRGHRRRRYWNP